MMITTKGQARFHETFPSNNHLNHNGSTVPFDNTHSHNFQGNPGGMGAMALPQGTKRLASCREELELSWTSSSDSDFGVGGGGGGKRRRTMAPTTADQNNITNIGSFRRMVSEDAGGNTVDNYRITPTNRPPKGNDSMNDVTPSPSDVKAGWYQGQIDPQGNRHGKGVTKHDDGTEYEGLYVKDVMEGMGRYKFVTERQLVPVPSNAMGCIHVHRQLERSFEGVFTNDKPNGMGIFTTRTTDSVPQGTSGHNGWNGQVKSVQVVYDVGYHKADGSAVGEGVRFSYSKNEDDMAWQESCYRLYHGKSTDVQVARDYAEWVCSCLGVGAPAPPSM